MCRVQLRCTVTSPVAGGEIDHREIDPVAPQRPATRALDATQPPPEVDPRRRRPPGDRDADGEPAALVAVTTEGAVLVPGDVGDPLDHPEGLHQGFDPGSPAEIDPRG